MRVSAAASAVSTQARPSAEQPEGPLWLPLSGSQLEQVVLNLVVNARDAMPRGGRITLTTANLEVSESNLDEEDAIPPGSWVTLRVSDTGAGMEESMLSRIFDPFFTTKPVGVGTGLGLSLSHGIIERHGGRIAVDPAPGGGTIFTIDLPLVVADQAE